MAYLFTFYRESRRANGNLRHSKTDDLLATMLMLDGTVSPRYPKDLKSLFELDGVLLPPRYSTFSELIQPIQ